MDSFVFNVQHIQPDYTKSADLFLHFFHFLYRAAALRTLIVTVTQQANADVITLPNVLLFLFLCLLQLALGTETLTVVHMVGLHYL